MIQDSPPLSIYMRAEDLESFLLEKMSMTDVYQPVIIRELILNDGECTRDELALTLFSHDEFMLKKFRRTVMRWPKETLTKHEVIGYQRKVSMFNLQCDPLTEEEKANLVGICDSKIKEFSSRQKKVGSSHAGWGLKRYKAIKQAKGKCELCGIPKELRPLDADHIVPKTDADKNGKVEIEGELVDVNDQKNIQALCEKCNRSKGNMDNTDFRKSGKLIRDNIPEIIREDGKEPIVRILSENEIVKALEEKLIEEHEEYIQSSEVEELGDLMQVIFSLANEKGVTPEQLLRMVEEKRIERGGFEQRFHYSGNIES